MARRYLQEANHLDWVGKPSLATELREEACRLLIEGWTR